MGGAGAEVGGPFAERVRQAWKAAGREGEPRLVALAYFGIGEDAEDRGGAYLSDYYGGFGPRIAAGMPKRPEELRAAVTRFEDAGFTDMFFDPSIAELDQLERLADAVL